MQTLNVVCFIYFVAFITMLAVKVIIFTANTMTAGGSSYEQAWLFVELVMVEQVTRKAVLFSVLNHQKPFIKYTSTKICKPNCSVLDQKTQLAN